MAKSIVLSDALVCEAISCCGLLSQAILIGCLITLLQGYNVLGIDVIIGPNFAATNGDFFPVSANSGVLLQSFTDWALRSMFHIPYDSIHLFT